MLSLARGWPRVDMSRAALSALGGETSPPRRHQLAWLVKHVLASEHVAEATAMVLDPSEDPVVQGWVINALEGLALLGALSWHELRPVFERARTAAHSALRVRAASLLSVLPYVVSDASALDRLLHDDDPEVVVAAASALKRHTEAVGLLNPDTLLYLRSHQHEWVRQTVAEVDAEIRRRDNTTG